jgi:hypothetical protein
MFMPDTYKDLSAVAGGSIVTVWTPATGKKVRFMGLTISASAACSVLFEDNAAAGTVFRTPKLLADTPYTFDLGNGFQLAGAYTFHENLRVSAGYQGFEYEGDFGSCFTDFTFTCDTLDGDVGYIETTFSF